ncbi:acyl-CoA thioesterase [Vallitalea okinawensis]|uniref:acyl-CoA thioesterase n=1 Tax=Vallitalea okinawensis TaxID=2078660 RepID=UPI000CFDDA73|nr:thioesterase family protein [Vallitalea okinawensis]
MAVNETKIKVRYAETDQMGVVHHSRYYPWFEVGRTELLAEGGLPYREIEEQGIMFPLVESSCKYKEGARYEDILIIKSFIDELKAAKFTMSYEVIREADMKILATGKTVHAITDKNLKLVNLKKVNIEVWNLLHSLSELQ